MKNLHVLIVDDDPLIASTLKLPLEERGFDVSILRSSSQAESFFKERSTDLIVLDILLPGKDGVEVLKNARAQSYNGPVIVMTNLDHPDIPQAFSRMGVKDFYIKSDTRLNDLVQKIMEKLHPASPQS